MLSGDRKDNLGDNPDLINLVDNFELKSHKKNGNQEVLNLNLLNSVNMGILVIDQKFKTIFVNSKAKELLGFNSSELLRKDNYNIVFNNSTKVPKEKYLYYPAINSGRTLEFKEIVVHPKNKKSIFINLHCRPFINNGLLSGCVLSFFEITDIIEYQNKILNESKIVRKYFDELNSFILLTNRKGNIQDINKYALNILGVKKEDILNKNLFKDFGKENRNKKKNLIDRLKNEKKAECFEIEITINRSVYKFKFNITEFLPDNKTVSYLFSGENITKDDINQTQINLYEQIIKNVKDPVSVVNKNFEYILINDAYLTLFQMKRQDIEGKKVSDLLGKEFFEEKLRKLYKKCFSGEEIFFKEWINPPDGQRKFMDIRYYPIFNKNRKVDFTIVNARDITQEKQIEESIKEREEYYKALIEYSPVPTILHKDYKIIYINDAAAQVMELGNKYKFIGATPLDFIAEDFKERARYNIEELYNTKDKLEISEFRFLTARKKILDVEVIAKKIKINQDVFIQVMFNDITLRKNIEKTIKNSKDLYLGLLDEFPALIWRSTEKLKIEYFNKTWLIFTGTKKETQINDGWLNQVHPDDRRIVMSYMSLFNTKESFELTFRLKRFDGEYRWMNNIGKPYYDIQGNFLGFIGVCFDITSRINLEIALRESKEKYKRFFADDLAANFVINIDGEVIECNKAFLDLFGFINKFEIDNIGIGQIFSSDEEKNEIFEMIKKGKKLYYYETKLKRKDGTVFDSITNIVGVLDEKGQLYQIRGYIIDNSEKKEAERTLQLYNDNLETEVRERTKTLNELNKKLAQEINKQQQIKLQLNNKVTFLQTLLDTIPNPIFIKNRQKQLIDCNFSFEQFVGKRKNDMTGNRLSEFPSKTSYAELEEIEDIVIQNSGKQVKEFRVKVGEEVRDIQIIVQTYYLSDETIAGVVGVIFDLTDQIRLQEEIRNAFYKEKELSELKSRFISTASHEFRTPLTSILASADLLEMFGREWEDIKYFEHITKIQTAVLHMTELLDDVLTVSRAETGKLFYSPEKFILREFISEILAGLFINEYYHNQVVLKFDEKITEVNMDKKLIRYILQNLLSNAVKYSPLNAEIYLTVGYDESYKNIDFEVSDRGIGIPLADQPKLFEPFHRAANIGNISGTGLGLSIVQKAVELHNGRISFKSNENVGTTFYIKIPNETDKYEKNINN